MNREEAKTILLLYRHHAADEQDVEIAEALAVARRDPELARWLEMHCARQFVLREKFRQIPVPEGLREQIISEHAASRRTLPRRQFAAALAVVLLLVGVFWGVTRNPGRDDALDNFRNQMVSFALRGYAMDVLADDVGKIRIYLAEKKSPADFVLPAHLQAAAVEGCAVAGWQDRRVSMLCFRTGRRLAPDTTSDLWLFVADAKSVNNAPTDSALHFAQVNRLTTATWVQDGRIYFLGLEGDEAELKKFL